MRHVGEPHHDGSALYVSIREPALGSRVTLWLRAPRAAGITGVHVRTVCDGEPRYAEARVDESRTGTPVAGYGADDVWWQAEVTAVNPVTPYRFLLHTRRGQLWRTPAGPGGPAVTDASDIRLGWPQAPPAGGWA
ncbi:hypothetical protein ABT267_38890, partial [Nonomuraea sp. NPDC001023]